MSIRRLMRKLTMPHLKYAIILAFVCIVALSISTARALYLTSNDTGTHNGFYYTFWKDSGDASMDLSDVQPGRYQSQWSNSTNNWVGGLGWNPGGPRIVNYEGYYGVDNSQNSYLALYGWTTDPLIEYYVVESYGSYNPSTCSGGQDYGSFQSDGATYNVRRCLRENAPSIIGNATFYQYFSVRTPKKGFGNISGTITVQNHFDYWASQGLNLGNFDYMVFATEGYQSSGSSDITVSEGSISQPTNTPGPQPTSDPSGSDIIVRARGTTGGEHINLHIGGNTVASWNLTTSNADYVYTGGAAGDLQVEFDNDGGNRDVILDYVFVNGETRQAEDMEYNTATYGNGECGGGSYSETMHCNGVIGFGDTDDCFSGNCNGTVTPIPPTSIPPTSTAIPPATPTPGSGNGNIVVRARGVAGGEHINLRIGGNTVASWNLTTGNADYVYTGNAAGDLQVEFDNDGGNRDVILDYVFVNGETRQAEDMEYNTATYGNGECGGGSYSETMHCNGIIGFGDTDDCFSGNCNGTVTPIPATATAIPPATATPGSGNGNIVVRARGVAGGEHINLHIGGNTVASWNLTTSNADYVYTGGASGDIQVEFDNDGGDLDVILDYVIVNGDTRQAENMEYNTATYGNGQCGGGSYSETMHCNGVIGFGNTGVSPTVVPPTSTPGSGVDPNFHIYLMIGQSNMEGQGQISSQDNQVPNGLLVMHADNNCTVNGASYGQWRTATPPLIRCYDVAHSWNNGGLGPGDYFGRTMLQNSDPGVTIGLVGAAYQGQSIDFFLKNCAQLGSCQPSGANGSVPLGQGGYAWLLDLAQKAQQDGVIKGIIFHQGESDTGDASWPGKVNQMVTDLRNDLGTGNVPFIAGEMVPGACCTSHNTYVHQIESTVSNGHWVSASGLGSRDEYHFDAAGYRELGRRYANTMLPLVD